MHTRRLPFLLATAAFLGILCTANLASPAQAEPPAAFSHAHAAASTDGGSGSGWNHTVARYLLDTRGLPEQVAQTGSLLVTNTAGEQFNLLLEEFEMMVRRSYLDRDADGLPVTKPFLGRTFNGKLATDPDSRVFMLVSPNGLYGSVTSGGQTWSFQPMREQPPSTDGRIVQEVSTFTPPAEAEPAAASALWSQALLGIHPATPMDMAAPSLEKLAESVLGGQATSTGPDGYSFCANEGSWCAFGGHNRDVAYGADGLFFYRQEVSGGINCDNLNFGDPNEGTYKACYIKKSATAETAETGNQGTNPRKEATYNPDTETTVGPDGYTFCAREDQYCGGFSGAKDIAYGVDGHFYFLHGITGGIQCTNENFGDPKPYSRKACYLNQKRGPDGGPYGYSVCTTEGHHCSFTGTKDVAYGASGAYYYKYGVMDGIDCTNTVFGDPNYGVQKACYTHDGLTLGMSSAPCGSADHVGYCGLYVKPYADQAYTEYASDWYNRIVAAYGGGVEMWQEETNIQLFLYEPENAGVNFEAVPNTNCKYNDGGLAHFQVHLETTGLRFAGPNSYSLFEAYTDMGTDGVSSSGVGGCGNIEHLSDHNSDVQDPKSTHVLNAKQWHHADSWFPDEAWALGMASSHELTHNAGEIGHPTDGDCPWGGAAWWARENLMNNDVPFWCLEYWRTSNTVERVKMYSYKWLG